MLFKERQIPSMSLLAYALPAAAFAIPILPVAIHIPGLYAEEMGLGLATVAGVLLIARIFDIICDPLAGIISDRLKLPWGRRKTWVILGSIASGFALYKLFTPPAGVTADYLLYWLVILYVGWTFVSVPFNAWGAELSDTYDGRTRITTTREAFTIIGILVASIAPFFLSAIEFNHDASRRGIVWVAIMFGTPALIFLVLLVPERAPAPSGKPYFSGKALWAIAKNSLFRRLLSAWYLNGVANSLTAILMPLYFSHVLSLPAATRNWLVFAYFAGAVVALPFTAKLSRMLSKHRSWALILLMGSIGYLFIPFLSADHLWPLYGLCILLGATMGADLALPPAMQADVIDIDRLHTHEERAGLLFSFWGMATKLALASAVGIAFPLLELSGFVTDRENSSQALGMLLLLFAATPIVLKVMALGLMWHYPLSRKRQEALRRRLSRRPRKKLALA